jgi:regulator of replication initiation timing
MSRRRRSTAAFSLFSFQDIITSVTAILILLVLILALELVTRRKQAAASDPSVSRAALAEAVSALEALVGQLASVVPPDEPRPMVRRTRSELERDVRVVEDQARQAAADAELARAVEDRAQSLAAAAVTRLDDAREIREDVGRMKEEAARVDEEATKLALDNEREADRLAKKQEELVQQPSQGAELVFNAPEDRDTQAWIIEVSSDGLTVVKLGTNKRRQLGADTGPESATANWLSELNPGRDHALILIRPSGVDIVDDIRESLREAEISFGIDLIGEDQVVRDGMGEANAAGAGGDQR